MKIVAIGGPTGAGKDTVMASFLNRNPDYVRVPRSTTRPPRPIEREGVDYHFLSASDFDSLVESEKICSLDEFCGHRYGIDLDRILSLRSTGRNIIGTFGVCAYGLRAIYNRHVLLVYIDAPLYVLRERLHQRGDDINDIAKRMEAALKQKESEPNMFDCVIQNTGDVHETVLELERVISLWL